MQTDGDDHTAPNEGHSCDSAGTMRSSRIHQKTVALLAKFFWDIRDEIYKNLIKYVVGAVLVGAMTLGSYILGKSSATRYIVTPDKFGTFCSNSFFAPPQVSIPRLVFKDRLVANTVICGPAPALESTDPFETAKLLVRKYGECFVGDDSNGKYQIGFLEGNDSAVEFWETPNKPKVASCGCAPGQARIIAREKKLWCGMAVPDFEAMPLE